MSARTGTTVRLIALTFLLGSHGCTFGGSPKPTFSPQFTSGSIVIWADPSFARVLPPFVNKFTAQNPGTSVKIQEVPFDQTLSQLQGTGPNGLGPDLFVGTHEWLGALVPAGAVAPIDLGPKKDAFVPVTVQAFTYQGKVYGVPFAFQNVALLRNTELVPDAPATWEDLTKTALQLKKSKRVDLSLGMQVPDPYYQYPLFSALGGYLFKQSPDGTFDTSDVGLDSAGGLKAATAFGRWTKEGLIDPNVTYDVMVEKFSSGKAPFAITGPWAVAQPDTGFKATGVPFAVGPIPTVEGGTPHPFVGVQGFMVSGYSHNQDMARAFALQFMATDDAQIKLFEAGGRAPALKSAFDEVAAKNAEVKGFGESGENGIPFPPNPEVKDIWSSWTDAYTLIFNGTGNPVAVFKKAATTMRAKVAGG
jgi:arabinogalactan oligomer / maltooligosaccharide transport system substrate-binding protein